jgi:transposase
MQVVYSRCGGLDVHKASVTACVLSFDEQGRRRMRKKEFGAVNEGLNRLLLWLKACKVTHVAMESTGVYWKPVWYKPEKHFALLLANPQHMKAVPGRKTDQQDAEWIAELLAHGLLRPSFVPPEPVRQLRDLTRLRVQKIGEYNRLHNRIHKVLEDAGLKLSSVVSDILGASGRAILGKIVAGETSPAWLAYQAKSSLRSEGKQQELRRALQGHVNAHHRFQLQMLLEDVEQVERQVARLEQELVRLAEGYRPQIERLCTIPGVERITALTLLAELGADMTVFPDAAHAASWAGLCPGNCESAGKRKSNRTRKGNRWIRRALCQSAWAVSHKSNCHLTAFFYRKAARHGFKKAVVATAHQILLVAYHLLRNGGAYVERGGLIFDLKNPERTKRRLLRRLEQIEQHLLAPHPERPPQQPHADSAG